jgi:hypothetical protein
MKHIKEWVCTISLVISAGLTALSYVVHFDAWLSSLIKRTYVPLCVVWAYGFLATAVIVPIWRRSLFRAWEAPVMAGVVFNLPLVMVTERVRMGPSLGIAEHNAQLTVFTWQTVLVIVAYAIVADALYLWLKNQDETK